MNPQVPLEHRPPEISPESRPPILHWQEFEEVMKFNMDGTQRAAHAAKMNAEADQIKADTRMTNANATKQENDNFWFNPKVALTGLVILIIGMAIGALLQRHVGIVPW